MHCQFNRNAKHNQNSSLTSALKFCAKILPMIVLALSVSISTLALTNDEYENYRARLSNIRNSQLTVQMIRPLADYAFVETTSTITARLKQEVKSDIPNEYFIKEFLNVLEQIGREQEAQSLEVIIEKLHQNQNLEIHIIDELSNRMSEVQRIIAARPGLLPSAKDHIGDPAKRGEKNATSNSKELAIIPAARPVEDRLKGNSEFTDFLSVIEEIVTDTVIREKKRDHHDPILFREKEVNEMISAFSRYDRAVIGLFGTWGSGKKSVIKAFAQRIVNEQYPNHNSMASNFNGGVVIRIDATNIGSKFFEGLAAVRAATKNAPLYIVVENSIALGTRMAKLEGGPEKLQRIIEMGRSNTASPVRIIISEDANKFKMAFEEYPAIMKAIEPIAVREVSVKEAIVIAKTKMIPDLESFFEVKFEEHDIPQIVKNAVTFYPDSGILEAVNKTLQDLCVVARTANPNSDQTPIINTQVLGQLSVGKIGIATDPQDPAQLAIYTEELRQHINSQVFGQDRMVKDLTDTWEQLLADPTKGVRSILLMGPTGTGKTKSAQVLAKKVFDRESAVFEVDGNAFKDHHQLSGLFGPPPGYIGADKTKGALIEFLDDPAKGKFGGIIIINELEKATPELATRIMELLDRGFVQGGDGQTRSLKKHLVVFTSNRGSAVLYPPGMENWSDQEIDDYLRNYDEKSLKELFTQAESGRDDFRLPPEFLGRINRVSAARPISKATAQTIAHQEAAKFVELKKELTRIQVNVSDEVLTHLTSLSYSLLSGARPVENMVSSVLNSAFQAYFKEAKNQGAKPTRISMTLNFDPKTKFADVVVSADVGQDVHYELPRPSLFDNINATETRDKLRNLEIEMGGIVYGQDEVLHSISNAIRSHFLTRSSNTRPLGFFLAGLTGTGKTETGKAIAKAIYGDKKRAKVIPMSEVTNEYKLNQLLGYTGSKDIGTFEQALRENPNGGVIIWDEASNMGGGDKHEKEKLFKIFYNLLDEGRWTSPVTNKSYDLSKYIFLFTGNDMQEEFKGYTADDMRLAIWKDKRSRNKVEKALEESGIPPAFLGRLADLILMKPTQKEQVYQITEKQIQEELAELFKREFKLVLDKNFVADFTQSFYRSQTGGRSVRQVIEHSLKALIANVILANEDLTGKTIRLSVKDSMDPRPYKKSNEQDRVVKLYAEVLDEHLEVEADYDILVTDRAAEKLRLSAKDTVLTAYHEAGHAVANDPEITRSKLGYLTVRGADFYLGYARYDKYKENHTYDRARVMAKITSLVAGSIAQQMAGFSQDTGWSNDLEQARAIAQMWLIKSGGESKNHELKFVGVRLDEKQNPILTVKQQEELSKEMEKMIHEAMDAAHKRLTENWDLVKDVVRKLMKDGSIKGAEFDKMVTTSRPVPRWQPRKGSEVLENLRKAAPIESASRFTCESVFAH